MEGLASPPNLAPLVPYGPMVWKPQPIYLDGTQRATTTLCCRRKEENQVTPSCQRFIASPNTMRWRQVHPARWRKHFRIPRRHVSRDTPTRRCQLYAELNGCPVALQKRGSGQQKNKAWNKPSIFEISMQRVAAM